MSTDQIESFLQKDHVGKTPVRISFKTRQSLIGIFVKTADYNELKSKNFWRIVWESNIDSFKKSNDTSLARIFNGMEITKLSAVN
jgi:hypothetical protein